MRALILGLSVLAIVASARIAEAGLTTTPREQSVSADTATIPEETNQETEGKIGLTRTRRRKIQRELTRLGFETRANGKFDESTRGAPAQEPEQRSPKAEIAGTLQRTKASKRGRCRRGCRKIS
jgi:peptidoglycan hydrolase-like protein with peptidoglycan-binding domain